MGYTPAYLQVTVEALGAEWIFSTPDAALAAVSDMYARLRGPQDPTAEEPVPSERELLYEQLDATPPEMIVAYCEVFKQGVVGWRGVNDPATGQPLPCTPEHIAAIPTQDKFDVAGAYLLAMQRLREKKEMSTLPPTDSMPPAAPAER